MLTVNHIVGVEKEYLSSPPRETVPLFCRSKTTYSIEEKGGRSKSCVRESVNVLTRLLTGLESK